MKKIFKKLLILIMTAIMIIPGNIAFAKDEDTEAKFIQETKPIIENMKKEMTSANKTGDVNSDFTENMISANKGACDISKNLFKYESSKDAKEIANSIIKDSTANIEDMKKMSETLKSEAKPDTEKEAEYMNDYEENLNNMVNKVEDLKPSGSIEKDYLNIMVIHAEYSVKMCTIIIKYSDNNELKQTAEKEMKQTKNCMDDMTKMIQKSTAKK